MEPFISVEHISKQYSMGKKKKLAALSDITFDIRKGETLGIVGESGSGKSTLARMIMGIEPPDSGRILFEGAPISAKGTKGRLALAKKAQIIFQDPFASLDPCMTITSILSEGMEIHNMLDAPRRKERALELLTMVGLEKEHGKRYPHEFSGGQRQRIGIARALSIHPDFLICDEPISALDVSVQSHIMKLLKELQESLHLTYLFIAHDLNMVNYISDRIAVLYAGRVVELGPSDEVCQNPRHPYTQFLLDSVLLPDPDLASLDKVELRTQEITAPDSSSCGCAFAEYCPKASTDCRRVTPQLREVSEGHFTACFLYIDGGNGELL